jgi:hypothetical protein
MKSLDREGYGCGCRSQTKVGGQGIRAWVCPHSRLAQQLSKKGRPCPHHPVHCAVFLSIERSPPQRIIRRSSQLPYSLDNIHQSYRCLRHLECLWKSRAPLRAVSRLRSKSAGLCSSAHVASRSRKVPTVPKPASLCPFTLDFPHAAQHLAVSSSYRVSTV